MSVSALETVRAAFKADLEAITTTNGYRNTVRYVYEDVAIEPTEFPCMTLIFGESTLEPIDGARECYDLHLQFIIYGWVDSYTATGTTSNLVAAQDSLWHDVMKCILPNYTENIVSNPAWDIQGKPLIRTSPVYPFGENKGIFSIAGTIHVRHLDGTLI